MNVGSIGVSNDR